MPYVNNFNTAKQEKAWETHFTKNGIHHHLYILLFNTDINPHQAQAPANEKTITVKGAVKNETGEPLSGVSVVIKGTANGVTTKEDGYFN